MAHTVIKTAMMNNSFDHPINRPKDIIGMDRLGFNLQLELKAGAGAPLPASIPIRCFLRTLQSHQAGHLRYATRHCSP